MSPSRTCEADHKILILLVASLKIILLLLPAGLFAQDASTGAFRGTVLDPDGGLIQGANIAIVNAANSASFTATSAPTDTLPLNSCPPAIIPCGLKCRACHRK